MKKLFLFFIIFTLFYPKQIKEKMICPIGKEKFSVKYTVNGKKMSYDKRFDLRPIGPVKKPDFLPKCPSNNFVIYKDDFDENELIELANFINSDEYKSIDSNYSSYYFLYKIYQHENKDEETLFNTLLSSIWDMDNNKELKKNAIKELLLKTTVIKDNKEKLFLEMELYRQLGNFTKSEEILNEINSIKSLNNRDKNIIERQKYYIENRIDDPGKIEIEDKYLDVI